MFLQILRRRAAGANRAGQAVFVYTPMVGYHARLVRDCEVAARIIPRHNTRPAFLGHLAPRPHGALRKT